MATFIIAGILLILAVLALRSIIKTRSSGGCSGCSGSCGGCCGVLGPYGAQNREHQILNPTTLFLDNPFFYSFFLRATPPAHPAGVLFCLAALLHPASSGAVTQVRGQGGKH